MYRTSSGGVTPVSLSLVEGENYGLFLPTEQLTEMTIDGKPVSLFGQLTFNKLLNFKKGILNKTLAGVEYRFNGNYGDGQIYDISNSLDIVAPVTTGVTGAAYAAVVKEFTAPAGCTSVQLQLWCSNTNTGITYYDACEVRRLDGFSGDEGTLLAWARVANAGVWADGILRYIYSFRVDNNTCSNPCII